MNDRLDFITVQRQLKKHKAQQRHSRMHRNRYRNDITLTPNHPQPTLFDNIDIVAAPIRPSEQPLSNSIEDRFIAFHRANPHVLEAMRQVAIEAKQRGFSKWSIWGVVQVLRWELHTSTTSNEPWHINNSFLPIYARLIMNIEPYLTGFFELRPAKIDMEYITSQLNI